MAYPNVIHDTFTLLDYLPDSFTTSSYLTSVYADNEVKQATNGSIDINWSTDETAGTVYAACWHKDDAPSNPELQTIIDGDGNEVDKDSKAAAVGADSITLTAVGMDTENESYRWFCGWRYTP